MRDTAPERAETLAADARAVDQLYVANDGQGTVVGAVALIGANDAAALDARLGEMELKYLAVQPRSRRKGVARALVGACIDAAARDGAIRLVLSTQAHMYAAQRMYDALGFRRLPERDRIRASGAPMLAYVVDVGQAN